MNTQLIHLPVYLQVQRLKEEADRQNKKLRAKHIQTQLEYLDEGIKAWVDSLTPDQLIRRYTLKEIIELSKLQGRHRSLPQYEQLASVLRKNGFVNKRAWTNTSRNKRYWIKEK
jgi:hypothetical protein